MARQYSQRTFLRQTPNAVLKEYFAGKGLLGDVDFDALTKETDIEAVSEAIEALPDAQRAAVEADFEQVNELAYAKGVEAVWSQNSAGHLERACEEDSGLDEWPAMSSGRFFPHDARPQ